MANPVLNYVKQLYADKKTAKIPGLNDVMANIGAMPANSDDREIPQRLDNLISIGVISDQTFLDALFNQTPVEKLKNFPLAFMKRVFASISQEESHLGFITMATFLDKFLQSKGINGFYEKAMQGDTKYVNRLADRHRDLRDILIKFTREYKLQQKQEKTAEQEAEASTAAENQSTAQQTQEANEVDAKNNTEPVLNYIKQLYSSGEAVNMPGLKEALIRTFMHGSMGVRLRNNGFSADNLSDNQIPAFIDAALQADIIGERHFFLNNLLLYSNNVPLEAYNQIPIQVYEAELKRNANITPYSPYLEQLAFTIEINVRGSAKKETEFIRSMSENWPENIGERREYVKAKIKEYYGQFAQEHEDLKNIIKMRENLVLEGYGLADNERNRTQSQETTATAEASTATENQSTAQQTANANQAETGNEKTTATVDDDNTILRGLRKVFDQKDEKGLIMAETLMSACQFSPAEVALIGKQGAKQIPGIIDHKISNHLLDDKQFIDNLFQLNQIDLDQLPVKFYAEIVKSKSFRSLDREEQNSYFEKILPSIGFTDLNQLDQIDPDKVAYNHEAYSVILKQLTSLQAKNPAEVKESGKFVDQLIGEKLQAVLDNAPELTNNPEKRNGLNLSEKHEGNLKAAAEEALSYFEDTKDLNHIDFKALGLNKNFENYSVTTAKAVLAQYKLGAYAAAAQAKSVMSEQTAEKYSVVVPAEKDKPVNKFVNSCKNAMANFAKPQNLAKLGFRQVATNAILHFTEGAIPGAGAAVGLAMKLAECGKKIAKDKQKASEVWKQAAPDLARGVVTVGLSFTPVVAIAGPIAAVASVAVKGIQRAHEEGLKIGKGFFKRVLKEFTKKGNVVNMAMSVAGAAVGFGKRKLTEDVKEAGGIGAFWNKITGRDQSAQANETEVLTNPEEVSSYTVNEDGELINNNASATMGVANTSNQELSYVEQYLRDHPGAHLDKKGWMQNADGSYARNEHNQMFGDENRVFRALTENEQLDEFGNIVDKPTSFAEPELEPVVEPTTTVVQNNIPNTVNESDYVNSQNGEVAKPDISKAEMVVEPEQEVTQGTETVAEPESVVEPITTNAQEVVYTAASEDKASEVVTETPNAMQGDSRFEGAASEDKVSEYEQALNDAEEKADNIKLWERKSTEAERCIKVLNEKIAEGTASKENVAALEEWQQNKANLDTLKENATQELAEINAKIESTRPETVVEQGNTIAHTVDSMVNERVALEDKLAEMQADPTVVPAEIAHLQAQIDAKEQEIQDGLAWLDRNKMLHDKAPFTKEQLEEMAPAADEPVYRDGLLVRSEEELAAIDVLQERATRAQQFNSLFEEQQRELINIKAQAVVAEEQGNMDAYNSYKEQFENKFKEYVEKDQEFDRMSELANKGPGSNEYRERERDLAEVRAMASMNNPKAHEAAIKRFEDKWGSDWGTNAEGVRQYVRQSGSLKMEVPDVPQKNFAELGYHKQDDGTWLYDNGITKKVVQDINGNGIPDAGDTYDKTIEFGTRGGLFYSKNHSAGVYVESTKEQIPESCYGDKYLDYAIERERERLSGQDLQR